MSSTNSEIHQAMDVVTASAQQYLDSVHQLHSVTGAVQNGKSELLALQDVTAVLALEGIITPLAAISFERGLLRHLLSLEIAGLMVPVHEQPRYMNETAAEISNIIIGHSLADLEEFGAGDARLRRRTAMAPPLVLDNVRHLPQAQHCAYTSIHVMTDFGVLVISLIWPYSLFDKVFTDSKLKEKSS